MKQGQQIWRLNGKEERVVQLDWMLGFRGKSVVEVVVLEFIVGEVMG